jgi:hypothetical protein
MASRGITETEVVEAVERPETTYRAKDDPSRLVILRRTVAGRRLKVVVPAVDRCVVITVADRDGER